MGRDKAAAQVILPQPAKSLLLLPLLLLPLLPTLLLLKPLLLLLTSQMATLGLPDRVGRPPSASGARGVQTPDPDIVLFIKFGRNGVGKPPQKMF